MELLELEERLKEKNVLNFGEESRETFLTLPPNGAVVHDRKNKYACIWGACLEASQHYSGQISFSNLKIVDPSLHNELLSVVKVTVEKYGLKI